MFYDNVGAKRYKKNSRQAKSFIIYSKTLFLLILTVSICFSVIVLIFDVISSCRTAHSLSASCPPRNPPVLHGYTACRLVPAQRAARARLTSPLPQPTRSSLRTVCETHPYPPSAAKFVLLLVNM